VSEHPSAESANTGGEAIECAFRRDPFGQVVRLALIAAGATLLAAPQPARAFLYCNFSMGQPPVLTVSTFEDVKSDPCTIPTSNGIVVVSGGVLWSNVTINAFGFLHNGTHTQQGGLIRNFGTLNSELELINRSGTLWNDGTLNNGAAFGRGLLRNDDALWNWGALNNYDDLFNYTGTIFNYDTLNNAALLRNYGTVLNLSGGTLSNVGTLNNFSGGALHNFGNLSNAGTLNNIGAMDNGDSSTPHDPALVIGNSGTLNNSGVLRNFSFFRNQATGKQNNSGEVDNHYSLVNEGTLTNQAGGTLNMFNTLRNASGGTLTNQAGGTLNAFAALSNLYGGTVNNGGTLNIMGACSTSTQ
jgi:hypothetical protein